MVGISRADAHLPARVQWPKQQLDPRSKGEMVGYAQGPNKRLDGSPSMLAHDFTREPPQDYMHEVMVRLAQSISDASKLIEDKSHRVNEYQVMGATADAESTLSLLPDYELYDEIIESVLVTGPVSTAFQLQLGKRNWSTLLTNAQGFFLVAPTRIKLGRNDTRLLTPSVSGAWTLELTGYADIDYRYK